jgi:ElaB/YqjD/DUF883 family membrane-anchored ribosome-binding protein
MATTTADTPLSDSKSTDKQSTETPIAETARKHAHNTVDKIADQASNAERNLRSAAENSTHNITETQQQLKEKFDTSVNKAKQLSKDHPLATVGIAFAAGVLISALLRRS